MFVIRSAAKVRNLTNFPQAFQARRTGGQRADIGHFNHLTQGGQINIFQRPAETFPPRHGVKRANQRRSMTIIQRRIAPLQHGQRCELMIFHRIDHSIIKSRTVSPAVGKAAESAVIHMPPGAAGDLGYFRRGKFPHAPPVKFRGTGETHMVNIHIEPHADGVRRHQIIHIAVLVKLDLLVAGAGTERAHHHRDAALLPPEHLGIAINIMGREGHQRRAPVKAAEFFWIGVNQFGKARPRTEFNIGDKTPDQGSDGLGPEKHGFLPPARPDQPVGKHMPPVEIRRQLYFVHRQKIHCLFNRHAFDGTDPPTRVLRNDFLFARDQRHGISARRILRRIHHPVINLPRQQPKRQADHAGLMAEHPLHRQMGLARVGRPQHRPHPTGGLDRLV